LWIKDEGRNPSASFKDRASSVVVARAREIKSEVVVTLTGNPVRLWHACHSCWAKIGNFRSKNSSCRQGGAINCFWRKVILVDGNYDSAFDLTIEASQEFGWYCRNTGYNPFTAEGKKTAVLKFGASFFKVGRRSCPACIFVSVGDGNIISGIHKGLKTCKDWVG
jgi:threonine synthase